MNLYRDFASQEAIDAEYSPMATAPNGEALIADWEVRSAATVAELRPRLGGRHGPPRQEYSDVLPAGHGAPLHVFVHGGYWRRFSARDHAFVARPLVAAGLTTVVINYALCPEVTLDEIVRQTRAAIAWAYLHAGE